MLNEIVESIRSYDPGKALEDASTVPALWYTDAKIAQLEKKFVFANSWQYVGRSDQVRKAGDFLTTHIAGQPILVMRNKEGELKAVANVCRHRAARVECRSQGNASRFRCRYHGWAYDLNGRLCGTPDFEGVNDFDKGKHPLPGYHVSEWGQFVFVHIGENPQSFSDFVAPLEKYRESMKLDSLKFHSRKEWTLRCNWKIFIDNYQDGGYHINTLHPDLATVVDMNTYDTELFPHASLQLSPLKEAKKGEQADTLNDVRTGTAAHYWWYNPNLMLNVYDRVMDINIVQPIDEKSCKVIFDFYFHEDFSESDQKFIDNSLEVSEKVQDEDIEICEEIQNNLATGSFLTGRFSVRREAGGHLFHNLLARSLQRNL